MKNDSFLFQYNVCDINCCCDNDCSETEKDIFANCKDDHKNKDKSDNLCYPYEHFPYQENNFVDNLFCIIKTNLPEKRGKDLKKVYFIYYKKAC